MSSKTDKLKSLVQGFRKTNTLIGNITDVTIFPHERMTHAPNYLKKTRNNHSTEVEYASASIRFSNEVFASYGIFVVTNGQLDDWLFIAVDIVDSVRCVKL